MITMMASAAVASKRPPLPMRPTPHERDGRSPSPAPVRPHPQRTAAAEIGPRLPGAIYQNVDGRFEVLALVTVLAKAAALLRRDSARWAVIVRDTLRPTASPSRSARCGPPPTT